MKMLKRVTVKKNERGLLLRNGDFRARAAARHALAVLAGIDALRVETFALEQPAFTHGLADYLMAKEPEVVAAEFVRVELTETRWACAPRTACWSRCWHRPPGACTGRAWSTCRWR
jgi:hypothetical protein